MRGKLWLVMDGFFGASAVGIGAYHAHGLAATLEQAALDPAEIERRLELVETAYRYQILHAIVILCVGVFLRGCPSSVLAKLAGLAFVIGIVLFSGSLYGLALTGNEAFSRVAPIGGIMLIAGWVLVALTGLLTPDPGGPISRVG